MKSRRRTPGTPALLVAVLALAGSLARAEDDPGASPSPTPGPATEEKHHRLPFLAAEARKRGIELPRTYGVGLVYYHLERAIEISDVRVGRNGADPQSVSQFADLGSDSRVDNVNVKADFWILPFVNLYAIVGSIWNKSDTHLDVTLPPILPGGTPREFQLTVPTTMEGSVGGLGMTLAGGYGPFFFAYDINVARADLGFDDTLKATVSSLRAGWNGTVAGRPLRFWVNGTHWDTFAEVTGTVDDPDGGTLKFEVDQGPAFAYTYGAGASWSPKRWLDLSLDAGFDLHGGWYTAVVPVIRF
ncbi:MAG TPA: hypothetical protein VFC25_17940 [Verrucomicrobiae bacterium]|nr:hypothetical protein [Verrucomicrobiae bacterium]